MTAALIVEVARIVSTVLREPVAPDPALRAADFARWDSHATVEIIFAIEDRFGFEMSPEQMERVAGLANLIDIVGATIGGILP